MQLTPPPNPAHPANCPACSARLPDRAVLCIQCGFNLKLGRHMATLVERETRAPIDQNPYAPSVEPEPVHEARPGQPFAADLTEDGARQARAVVSDAGLLWPVLLLSLCCLPLSVFMFPWYALRLWSWHRLKGQYVELAQPNSFSPHGELAVSFEDCYWKLWVGTVAGAALWVLLFFGLVLRVLLSR